MSSVDLHSFYTVLMFFIFIGICFWAWSSKSKKRFEDAANLPFADQYNSESGSPYRDKETHHE
jgi:cytochrome c oxidase cbb3-type subunit 4